MKPTLRLMLLTTLVLFSMVIGTGIGAAKSTSDVSLSMLFENGRGGGGSNN